ncbi:MAG TPA: LacI family DNA-binding transcriptional regulator [Opitutaceae bacterium]
MKPSHVSQRDIASKAGVSVSAVSLALRNHPKISPEVRARIQKIARRLGYRADPKVAQLMEHLRTARARRAPSKLAVIVPELTAAQLKSYHPIMEMIAGAREQAAEAGFEVDVFHLVSAGMTAGRLHTILRTRRIQGVFVAPFASGVGRLDFDFTGFAAATAGYSIIEPLLHRSCPNYLQMMDETLEWVTRQGYRRVGFVLTYRPGGIGHKLFSSSFLYYQNHIPAADRIPILPKDEITDGRLLQWVQTYRPEVIISSGAIYRQLTNLGVPVPKKIKFANMDLSEPPQDAAGVDHRYRLVGRETVKLILSQLLLNMTGLPDHPKIVLVDSHWRPGFTMPGNPSRNEARAAPLRQD